MLLREDLRKPWAVSTVPHRSILPGLGQGAQAAGLGYQAGGSSRGTHQAVLMGADTISLALLPINIFIIVCPAAQRACCRGNRKDHKR